jgi:uncharacterized membrane protein YhhN
LRKLISIKKAFDMYHRTIFILALIIGISHLAVWAVSFDDTIIVAWKTASVGMLAVYASAVAKTVDGRLLGCVLVLSAFSDFLLQITEQVPGAISFIVADIMAIILYYRHANTHKNWAVLAFVTVTASIAYLLPTDRESALGIAIFVIPLATMAAMAWRSTFPRLVAVGATLVLLSDMAIFAHQGPLENVSAMNYIIWTLYFAGEALICFWGTQYLAAKATDK